MKSYLVSKFFLPATTFLLNCFYIAGGTGDATLTVVFLYEDGIVVSLTVCILLPSSIIDSKSVGSLSYTIYFELRSIFKVLQTLSTTYCNSFFKESTLSFDFMG